MNTPQDNLKSIEDNLKSIEDKIKELTEDLIKDAINIQFDEFLTFLESENLITSAQYTAIGQSDYYLTENSFDLDADVESHLDDIFSHAEEIEEYWDDLNTDNESHFEQFQSFVSNLDLSNQRQMEDFIYKVSQAENIQHLPTSASDL